MSFNRRGYMLRRITFTIFSVVFISNVAICARQEAVSRSSVEKRLVEAIKDDRKEIAEKVAKRASGTIDRIDWEYHLYGNRLVKAGVQTSYLEYRRPADATTFATPTKRQPDTIVKVTHKANNDAELILVYKDQNNRRIGSKRIETLL